MGLFAACAFDEKKGTCRQDFMALVNCYECGKQVSTLARACPQCGAPQPSVSVPAEVPPSNATLLPERTFVLSAMAQNELVKKTKISVSVTIAWTAYGLLIPSAVRPSYIFPAQLQSVSHSAALLGFLFGVASFREWLKRRTARVILKYEKRNLHFSAVYFLALWSYLWRSGLTFVGIGILFGILPGGDPHEIGPRLGTIIASWLFATPFVLDVPFWVWRRVQRLTKNPPVPEQEPHRQARPSPRELVLQREKNQDKARQIFCVAVVVLVLAIAYVKTRDNPVAVYAPPSDGTTAAAASP